MKLSKRIQNLKPSATLALTAHANKLKAQGVDIIGFGAGEPDFDTPAAIKEAAVRAIESGKTKYTPAGGIKELKDAVILKFERDNKLKYDISEVTINCGGKHSFYNLMQVILDEGDEIIIPGPYWVSYPPMAELAGGVPVIVPCGDDNGFRMTADQLKKAITARTKAVVLNSPSNPTGSAYSRKEMESLAEVLDGRDILIISDDIYESILYDNKTFLNMANLSETIKKKTIVLNGVSKAYSMTGWRIGYMAGNKDIIKGVETLQSQSTSNPASISQWAAVEALTGDQSVINEMVSAFSRRRSLIVSALNRIPGVSCLVPDGAFYAFPRVKDVYSFAKWPEIAVKYGNVNNSSNLCSYLLNDAGVAVVPGVEFGDDDYMRLSYAMSDEQIEKGVARIAEAVSRLK